MKISIREDKVTIEGYVNAVERNSKPLTERGVTFIERIGAGAFKRAIARAKDIRILLNHKKDRDLGGLSDGNLELEEDNIGLKARAEITDPEVIEDARKGNLVGWSFGFVDDDVTQLRDEESGLPLRKVNDLVLYEVSLLNRSKSPAYVGTLVNVRDDGTEERVNYSEEYEDEVEVIDEVEKRSEETREETKDPEDKAPEVKELSSETLARYKNIIAELKSLVKN
jgi:HK97 family phage prohead protease